jgi:shikimate kinase
MGVGKTTVGKKLAKEIDFDFVDTDDLFEKKYKISIETFFSKYNETLFREFENKILKNTFDLKNTVISCGGGTPCYFNAMKEINQNGISVYLKMPVDVIVQRLLDAIKPRPLVKGKNFDELKKDVESRLSGRLETYQQAAIHFDAVSPDIAWLQDKIRPLF